MKRPDKYPRGVRVRTEDGDGTITVPEHFSGDNADNAASGDWEMCVWVLLDSNIGTIELNEYNWEELTKLKSREKEAAMDEKNEKGPKFGERLKKFASKMVTEGQDAGWLTLGKQAARVTVNITTKVVRERVSPAAADWLEDTIATPVGLALYAVGMGSVMSLLPAIAQSPTRERAASAMRTWGMHVVTDTLLEPVVDQFTAALDGLSLPTGRTPPARLAKKRESDLPPLKETDNETIGVKVKQ